MWEILPQTMFLYDTFSSLTTLLSTWQYFAGQPPLLTKIWGLERGALQLPFLPLERRSESIFGIQSAPCFQAIYGVESVPRSALSLKMGVKAPPRSGPQILVKSGGCPPKYCQVDSNVVRELYYIIIIFEFIFHQASNNNTK